VEDREEEYVPTLKDKGFPKAALNIWSGVFSCGALIIAFLVMSSSLWIAGLKRLGRFIPQPSTK